MIARGSREEEQMSNPVARLWRAMPGASRRTRRIWVVLAFLGFPLVNVGYAALVEPGWLSRTIWAPIVIVLFGATLVGVFAIYGYARDKASMDADLDEREQRIRDQAWIHAYGFLATVVVAVVAIIALITSTSGPVTIGMEVIGPVGISLALYLPILPSAMLAWTEPDVVGDDADDPRPAAAGSHEA
jgi:hypothetical protein